MNIPSFFKFLNKKIEKYNKIATNPFSSNSSFVVIWVEDTSSINDDKNNKTI